MGKQKYSNQMVHCNSFFSGEGGWWWGGRGEAGGGGQENLETIKLCPCLDSYCEFFTSYIV